MTKHLTVPKGKDIVSVWVTGHTHVRLIDSKGDETFRFDSPGKHVTAAVHPGSYTIETDGKLGKVELASLPSHLKTRRAADAAHVPTTKRESSRRSS